MNRLLPALVLAVLCTRPAALFAQKNFGFDNRKPSGQEYLSPEESLKRMKVADGFVVKLFAAEPDIVNPIAFTVDERGRLWVVECYEYPKRTPKGQKPRDRIKVLEDTDGDGKCDKVSIFAEGKDLPIGFDMASGIEVGHGGVFLGAPPYLFFLQDTDGDGKCDKQEILLEGFGSQDTHETLNTFQWGPDGWLYGLHGIFTQSKVGEVKLNAAVWRYHPSPLPLSPQGRGEKTDPLAPGGRGEKTDPLAPGGRGVGVRGKFEVFAEGTSNPWGMDFDDKGNAFVCCCVIPHLFHIVQGGVYKRQAGQSNNPYAYGYLNEICDHTFHKESGWAHAGLLYLQGEHIPKEYRGSVIFGSIHGCSIKRNTLKPNGSTFTASRADDFLVSGDKNFRPINLRWAHDGGIYVIDWHDQNPCHQALPDSWDQKHGRIYKIQPRRIETGPPPDLSKLPTAGLIVESMREHNNPWMWRTALRLLAERKDKQEESVLKFMGKNGPAKNEMQFRLLWEVNALGAFDLFDDWTLNHLLLAESVRSVSPPGCLAWSVRLFADAGKMIKRSDRVEKLAKEEGSPEDRLQLASTAQRLSRQVSLPIVHDLMMHKEDATDPCLPLMYWLAYEPHVAAQPQAALDWLRDHAGGNPLITDAIVPRAMRRLVATGKAEDRAACVVFLGDVTNSAVRKAALDGLTQALQNQQVDPPAAWKTVRVVLYKDADPDVQRLARKLAVNFRDAEAVRLALTTAMTGKEEAERVEAIRELALAHPAEALRPLQELLLRDGSLAVRTEACRALAAYDSPEVGRAVLDGWKQFPPQLRGEAVNLLASRREWARELLAAVGTKAVPRTDLTDTTILRIKVFKEAELDKQIETVWGRFRDTPAELNALLVKMREQLHTTRASPVRGRKVFEVQCAKCHKFDGQGAEVGPNLDGAARDAEYLLANVLDPNRVVGQPYYLRTVVLKNGLAETGLLAAEDGLAITLKGEKDVLKVIQKKDVEQIVVQEKSIMPEGLTNNMTVQDFCDLVRYLQAHPYLTEVAIAGPFAAKEATSIKMDDPLASPGVTWMRPAVGPPGRIPLLPAAGAEDAVCHVAAELMAPKELKTQLHLAAAHSVQVWLNGKEVYRGRPGPSATPDNPAAVSVTLPAGVNRLLLRINYRGTREAVYARFLDPDRLLQYPESKDSAP